jgi:dTDP-4-amino-4,6-dideoxygalactose transaminase
MAQVEKIVAIAERYGIALIEDAADALGSQLKNKKAGTWGRLGIFSFNGNKIITTSGGGALLSHDKALIDKARYLATQAKSPYPFYHHEQNGFNYRLSNILAGIGLGQMKVLESRIAQRRFIFEFYKSAFADLNAISFSQQAKGSRSNHWLSALLIDPKLSQGTTNENIRIALENENIESRLMWKPMHLQPVFSHCLYFGEGVAERIFQLGLCLPSGSSMTKFDLERVVELVRKELIVVMEK